MLKKALPLYLKYSVYKHRIYAAHGFVFPINTLHCSTVFSFASFWEEFWFDSLFLCMQCVFILWLLLKYLLHPFKQFDYELPWCSFLHILCVLGAHWYSWISGFIVVIKSDIFYPLISSNIFFSPFMPSQRTPLTHILVCGSWFSAHLL